MKQIDLADALEDAADALPDLVFANDGTLMLGTPSGVRPHVARVRDILPRPTRPQTPRGRRA